MSRKDEHRISDVKEYVSNGFVAFAAGSLTANVSVPSGYYRVGYRFVETATGRETAVVPLSVVTVSLSLEDGGAEGAPAAARKKAA